MAKPSSLLLFQCAVFSACAFSPVVDGFAIDPRPIKTFSQSRSQVRDNACPYHGKRASPTSAVGRGGRLDLSANDVIEAGVSFDTFAPQFLWLLMIAAPRSSVTEKVMGPIAPVLALALVHLVIVVVAASQEGAISQIAIFGEVFDPSRSQLDGMTKLFDIRNFIAEEWPHVLVWDLFVGRIVWRDGLERGVDTRLSLSFCNFIGPPGLLIYAATCLIEGKGLPKL